VVVVVVVVVVTTVVLPPLSSRLLERKNGISWEMSICNVEMLWMFSHDAVSEIAGYGASSKKRLVDG